MPDFAAALAGLRCWDAEVDAQWYGAGSLPDCALQSRSELIDLCEFIQAHQIRSYLEIGIWTGRVVTALHGLFNFDTVAVCDVGVAAQRGLQIQVPQAARIFPLSSHSIEYMAWRQQLGHIDLVMIDGDHSYEGVRRDFEINRRYPHRYLAFHDIANPEPQAAGVARLWRELEGEKVEIIRPEPGIRARMGIGIWRACAL